MNAIKKLSLERLGYGFIEPQYLPEGQDEYYLRNLQNRNGISYRQLTAYEIEVLVRNRNSSDNWNNLLVSDAFNPELVVNCKFYGLVRIGKLEPYFLEFSQLRVPVGLYNSTIISCDFGDNVVVDNVHYLSHYIIGSEAILVNVNEMLTTPHAKFGNGILKEGEPESIRIWLELCNENAGRSVIPFNGMLAGDAWLWSKYRNDEALLEKLKEFTQQQFDTRRGYYGKVGDRTVIKNCAIIKDVWIGSDAYLKGANKLKNLTINSSPDAMSQIGEGCEMVNGIIGFGCRAFYGVKAVRFVMASHSQLKYGARLINSYLGDNATISCCEVLNSLIFPAHEQHHNNSFLCASLVMGQSNMAAGATIGSNHNSRSPDGELIAGRGFWPGLCVSLKHNSRFASFTMIAKGDYPAEMNIPLPFSLVSQNEHLNQLQVMPAYWFMYNMYALARNARKYNDRDKRTLKLQLLEYDYLAPDTANEMTDALALLQLLVGRAWMASRGQTNTSEAKVRATGRQLLEQNNPAIDSLLIEAPGFENTSRKTVLLKTRQAYQQYKTMLEYYSSLQLMEWAERHHINSTKKLVQSLPARLPRKTWVNAGGQLMHTESVDLLIKNILKGKIADWDQLHGYYETEAVAYATQKALHAFACLQEVTGKKLTTYTRQDVHQLAEKALETRKQIVQAIEESRTKDYTNPFRKMVYTSEEEMNKVLGPLKENSFIAQEKRDLKAFDKRTAAFIKNWVR